MKNQFRIFSFACFFILIACIGFAQNPKFSWAASWGNTEFDFGPELATDHMGNVYMAGYFKGTTDFDPGPGTTFLTSGFGGFGNDSYITKFDSAGNFLWVKQIGGASRAKAILYNSLGFLYIGGEFCAPADFDPGPGTSNLTPINNTSDGYVLILDLDGNFISAQNIGGNGQEYLNCISFDNAGNLLIGGLFSGTSDFDPGPDQTILIAEGLVDLFVVKLDINRSFVWAKAFSGNFQGSINAIGTDTDGNIYTAGVFDDIRDFDPGPDSVILTATGYWDIFIVKLNPDGAFQWIRRLGNGGDNWAEDIKVDVTSGHLYTTGYFSGRMDFNPGPDSLIYTATNTDPYIWKLDFNGSLIWANQFAGISFDQGRNIALDEVGSVYLTGRYGDMVDFDPGPGEYILTSTGHNDMDDAFIAKLTSEGDFQWAYSLGGLNTDVGTESVIDVFGNIFITGYFQDKAGFYPDDDDVQDSLMSAGAADAFLVRWTQQCIATSGEISPVACDNYISPSGNEIWDESGVYIDTLTNTSGCDSIITIHLTVLNPDPTIELTGTTLTAVQDDASYQWVDCDNGFSPIAGATSQSFTPSVSGNYAVIINYGGCEPEVSVCINVMLVDIQEQKSETAPRLYPNPTAETWFIRLSELNANVQVEVSDLSGMIVFSTEVKDTNVVPIDTDLPAGVYLLKVIANNKQYILRGVRTNASK